MVTITNYASQINGVNTSVLPTATMVKTDFDAGTSQLTGYIYGAQLNALDTPVDGQADLTAFKEAAIAAINADFLERYEGRATLIGLDFLIEVEDTDVIAGRINCQIVFEPNEENTTQFQNVFGLVFDSDKYVLANALGGFNTVEGIAAPTTLLAQQGRRPLQL
jgi:hypothetical protein